jgi:hypothetical protein
MPDRLREVATRATGDPGGGWGPLEVALHLAAVEQVVWQTRLRDLEAQEAPVWTWTEPALASGARDETLGSALTLFGQRRAATVALVESLSPVARARVGTHSTYGPLDLPGLLAVAVDHDEQHLADLERLAGDA